MERDLKQQHSSEFWKNVAQNPWFVEHLSPAIEEMIQEYSLLLESAVTVDHIRHYQGAIGALRALITRPQMHVMQEKQTEADDEAFAKAQREYVNARRLVRNSG